MNKLLQLLAGLGALASAALAILLQTTARRARKAELNAQRQAELAKANREQLKARVRAELASTKAAEEGDRHVEQVRAEARTGRRDHFTTGLHDD